MKYYKLNKINEHMMFVHSVSHHSPTEQLTKLEKELNKISFEGKLIFDLLLSHGNTSQRFYETNFHGSFTSLNFTKFNENLLEFKKFSIEFYKKNSTIIENSQILSNASKFLIKKGRII